MLKITPFSPNQFVYLKPRVLLILLLGFSSGLPLALSGSTLLIWMKEANVDLATIGLFSLVGLPYSVKFFWAPVVDAFSVPLLTRILGKRRAWLVATQLALIGSIIFLGSLDPVSSTWFVALGALIVAAASATQDIVIDAYRVEALPKEEQAAGVAYYVSAYRIAMLVSSAGTIFAVAYFQRLGFEENVVWFYGYIATAMLMVVGLAGALLCKEPAHAQSDTSVEVSGNPVEKFFTEAWLAFSEFLQKPYVLGVLLFIVLFKFCDALAGIMTGPFVLDIGFSKEDYAAIVKGVGLAATLVGTFAAGALAYKIPLYAGLWIAALVQMLSNLVFVALAWIGPEYWALVAAILVENFTGALGTIIFIAYLSALCGNTLHTATQYAVLTALSSVGRTLLSSTSGYIAEDTGWPIFFIITTLIAIPSLLLLYYLKQVGHFNELDVQKEPSQNHAA